MSHRRLALVFALLFAFVPPVLAYDITGVWTGTRKCKFFAEGVKTKVDREGTVLIYQVGNTVGFDTAIGSSHLYSGVANFGTEKPEKGELSIRHCRDHDGNDATPFDALGRFTVKTKEGKLKASLSGVTIVADDSTGAPNVGTCKWKLTRTAASNQKVSRDCNAP